MGVKIVGSAFSASATLLVQHGRASKYFGERHLWPSHLQAHLVADCRRGINLTFFISVFLLTVTTFYYIVLRSIDVNFTVLGPFNCHRNATLLKAPHYHVFLCADFLPCLANPLCKYVGLVLHLHWVHLSHTLPGFPACAQLQAVQRFLKGLLNDTSSGWIRLVHPPGMYVVSVLQHCLNCFGLPCYAHLGWDAWDLGKVASNMFVPSGAWPFRHTRPLVET